MLYDHISVGGGVIGINTTINLLKKFLNSKFKKKIKICVIDKNLSNVPGGVAYGKKTSLHGYFNNPLRLSHKELQKYYRKIKNFLKIEEHIKLYGSDYDKKKFESNLNILKSKNKKKIDELYLPRVAFSFLQEEVLSKILNKIINSNKKIQVDFFEGEVLNFSKTKKNEFLINAKSNFLKFSINNESLENFKITFKPQKIKYKNLYAKFLTLGLGIIPPKKLTKDKTINKNYIWDFYAEGGTSYLVEKIKHEIKSKKNVSLCFIGSKAGFLESLQEIYCLKKKMSKLKIYCFSKKFETLQPAITSFNESINLRYLKKSNRSIDTAEKLYINIFKELNVKNKKNNYKYLIWTKILSSNILNYFLKKLSKKELLIYQTVYFQKIRSITRFTFPETIKIKNILIKKKMISVIQEKVEKIILNKKSIFIHGDKNKYKFDIVVNVSGPSNLTELSKDLKIYKSILSFANKDKNILVNRDFALYQENNLFSPGTISQGFNDKRQTIIKAIIQNSDKSSSKIFKYLRAN